MSGGFFRGTSADQDTRFSNKQAKLLKSQKFAPELDHLVDVSKVKMDVVKPWIAHRVTELLGFEDEVLINFIYGLLDGKEINGKQVQIQITGFMEKNTGKFMKELWGLLISAQSNASGVPQQFLDAKEEEIRKKKAESDRINSEIQKKKELEQEKSKMDGEVDALRDADDASNRISKNLMPRASSVQAEDEKESDGRNGLRRRSRISRSPHSAGHSPSSPRITRSRSISKSLSNSRSHSGGRRKSDSISRSPPPRGRFRSVERRYRSPQRACSPVRRRSPYSRRRSSSHSWGRSPSPRRRRSITPVRRISPAPRRRRPPSPVRRRSPSPRRHRSPSPIRRRSPFARRRRSPSPFRRRSPPQRRRRTPSPVRRRTLSLVRQRSPSPVRRRSPHSMHRRSPLHRQTPSPDRRRSPGPTRKRSPSPSWHRSPSPRLRSPSPARRRSPSPLRRRSPPPRSSKQRRRSPLGSPQQRNRGSPYRSHSPAYRSRRSLSTDRDVNTNGVGSKGDNDNHAYERFPVRRGRNGPDSGAHQPAISMRSPQRDSRGKIDARRELPVSLPSPAKSPSRSESSPSARNSSPSEDRSLSESPVRRKRERAASADNLVRQTRDRVSRRESPEIDKVEEGVVYARGDGGKASDSPRRRHHSPKAGSHKNVPVKEPSHGEHSSGVSGHRSGEFQYRVNDRETSMKDREKKSEKARLRSGASQQAPHIMEEVIYGSGRIEGARSSPVDVSDKSPNPRSLHNVHPREDYDIDEKKRSRSHNTVDSSLKEKTYSAQKSMRSVDISSKTAYGSSDSEKNDRNKSDDLEKRKHKRSKRHETASEDDASYDSDVDGKKEAKRRRKEEKKLRKEERHRRRQERHRRREERRAGKLKAKLMDTVTPPSDIERNRNGTDDSDGQVAAKRDSHPSDTEEMESEQKILEIQLRKKALESLRARKAINP